eukprot:snap_masked-scaffold452_size166894-processed-gene-0.18 protein:Tk11715 transcript:snap_masked-scaffold452_size166894-processed-gene-0.18-mRNA-1 annotation:"Uncharacterized protein C19orf29"
MGRRRDEPEVRGRSSRPREAEPRRRQRDPSATSSDATTSSSSREKVTQRRKKAKKARKKSRRRSRSSSSGAASDSSTELLHTLARERAALKKRRKAEKKRLKATETEEERQNRKLLKRELRALRQMEDGAEEEAVEDEDHTYTNEDNPFGDSQLSRSFRWDKKLQKEGLDQLDERELHKMERIKRERQRQELEKVKTERMYREKEREDFLHAKELEERMKENAKYSQWQDKEDEFHLEQARMRSKIRIQDGRAKPIDLLAKYISAEEELDTIEMHEPYTYLNGLTLGDLEDLLVDIRVYMGMDLERNHPYWQDIIVIVEDELHKLQKLDATSQYELAAERRQGINQAVAADIQGVFKDKSSLQLEALQKSIETKLTQHGDGLDLNYWESLLSQLKAHLARARLRDQHKANLKKKLEMLKAEQKKDEGDSDLQVKAESSQNAASTTSEPMEPEEEIRDYLPAPEDDVEDRCEADYRSGGYSPVYRRMDDLDLGTMVIDQAEDEGRRRVDQTKVLKGGKVDSLLNAEEQALECEAKKGMNDDEASFAVESALEQTYEWSDKYRPRKPRYFNRVHTGFEWNKYNQTHYDVDNPPPKIVQGYKFNIFYPDLIDKRMTPTYKITPCPDNRDFAILRVHAGPPYEDIAFKIVNREWEFGYKRGFKCQFHNNIFQLWFHFKRLRYRR